jgi:hypothetical protein
MIACHAVPIAAVYASTTITLDEYKALVADHIIGLNENEVQKLYVFDTTFAAFIVRRWLARRCMLAPECDSLNSS